MKALILILVLGLSAQAQWVYVTESIGGRIKFYYDLNWRILDNNDREVWIKAVPKNPRILKVRRASYYTALYTFHCYDNRVSMESPTFYSTRGRPVSNIPNFMLNALGALDRDPIGPGTVNDYMARSFCAFDKKTVTP